MRKIPRLGGRMIGRVQVALVYLPLASRQFKNLRGGVNRGFARFFFTSGGGQFYTSSNSFNLPGVLKFHAPATTSLVFSSTPFHSTHVLLLCCFSHGAN